MHSTHAVDGRPSAVSRPWTALGRTLAAPTAHAPLPPRVDGLRAAADRDARWRWTPLGDLDERLVVGPGGVLLLVPCRHPGATVWQHGDALLTDGQRQPHVLDSRSRAASVASALGAVLGREVDVRGVVVLTDPAAVVVRATADGVAVVADRDLAGWLLRRPPMLSDADQDTVLAVAAAPETWLAPAPTLTSGDLDLAS